MPGMRACSKPPASSAAGPRGYPSAPKVATPYLLPCLSLLLWLLALAATPTSSDAQPGYGSSGCWLGNGWQNSSAGIIAFDCSDTVISYADSAVATAGLTGPASGNLTGAAPVVSTCFNGTPTLSDFGADTCWFTGELGTLQGSLYVQFNQPLMATQV